MKQRSIIPPVVFDPITAQRIANEQRAKRLGWTKLGDKYLDFNFITPRLATGAALQSPDDVKALVDAGITHVIDCRGEFDDSPLFAQFPQISYLWNGTNDDGQTKDPEWFEKSIEFALNALSAPEHKVYAHCAAGINRGPSTAYAIIRAFGIDPAVAEQMIRTARPQVGLRYKDDADNAIKKLGYD